MLLELLEEEVEQSAQSIRDLLPKGLSEQTGRIFFIRTFIAVGATASEEAPYVVLAAPNGPRLVVPMKEYMEVVSTGANPATD
jgi:hypothetical protein